MTLQAVTGGNFGGRLKAESGELVKIDPSLCLTKNKIQP